MPFVREIGSAELESMSPRRSNPQIRRRRRWRASEHRVDTAHTLSTWTSLVLLSLLLSHSPTTLSFPFQRNTHWRTRTRDGTSQEISNHKIRWEPEHPRVRRGPCQFDPPPATRRWYATLEDDATVAPPDELPHPSLIPYIRDMERVLQNPEQWRRGDDSVPPPHNARTGFSAEDDDRATTWNTQFHWWCNEQRRQKPSLLWNDLDGAEKCWHMLRHLQQSRNGGHHKIWIPESTYQMVMKAFLLRGRLRWKRTDAALSTNRATASTFASSSSLVICAADQLEELLQDLEDRSSPLRNVSLATYNMVLEAYAICATPRGDRQYAQRAQALLQRMERIVSPRDDLARSTNRTTTVNARLPVESYLHVLHAYAWQQGNLQSPADAADEANRLLDTVLQSTNDTLIHMQATIWVLEAYSKCIGGARHCHLLLQNVQQYNHTLTEAGRGMVARQLFDAEVYSNAILAWSKAAAESIADLSPPDDEESTASTVEAATKANALLLELVHHYTNGSFASGSEPPLIAFNGVISAWSRIRNTDKAEEVLWLMERTVRPLCKNLVPNAISYNSVLHGIYRQSQPGLGNRSFKNCLSKDVALQKALAIVTYMDQNAGNSQPDIQPNSFSYHTLLKCWLQSGSTSNRETATEEAEKLLGKVEQLWMDGDTSFERTNRIYNMMLNAYAKTYSGRRFLSTKALDLLARMKQSPYAECQPDIISYTSTLECIAQSSDPLAPELAGELLQEVKARYETTKDSNLRPNLRTYTMTIQTLARNNGKVVRARELLTELVQQYESSGYDPQLKPNTFPYNYVLNCAANTMDPEKKLSAFQVATQTYQEMRHSKLIQPDSFSYAFWFKCCNNLLEHGALRNKGILYAFEECKRDGLVSNEVLTRLLQGSPKEIVNQLLQSSVTSKSEGPDAKDEIFIQQKSVPQHMNRFISSEPPDPPAKSQNSDFASTGYRSLTVQDLPLSWSRNARSR
jgi:hypothetical protein